MKNLKSSLLISTLFSVTAFVATTGFAAEANPLEQAYKSSNVKAALTNVCKTETAKSGKLNTAEVAKYCGCAIESDAKLTNGQKWEIQSSINQKKNPSTLAFVQKQNQDLQTCFGPQLTTKLKTLSEEAMKASQGK